MISTLIPLGIEKLTNKLITSTYDWSPPASIIFTMHRFLLHCLFYEREKRIS